MNRTNYFLFFFLLVSVILNPGIVKAEWIYREMPLIEFGSVKNNRASPICAAVATANSFVYLQNHYPDIYGQSLILDGNPEHTVIALAYGWENSSGIVRSGMYGHDNPFHPQDIWEQKVHFIEDFSPGTTIFDGQIKVPETIDLFSWHRGEILEDKYPTWNFLWRQIEHGEGVEIGICPIGGGGTGHVLTLTDLSFNDAEDGGLYDNGRWDLGEPRKISFLDPNPNILGIQHQITDITSDRLDDGLQFNWWVYNGTYEITFAFSESAVPLPLPGALWLLGSGLAILLGFRRK